MTAPEPLAASHILGRMFEAAEGRDAQRAVRIPERIGVERQPLPPGLRRAILVRDQYTCQWCLTQARGNGVLLEIDHIVPWSAGGADHPVNLRVLCTPCNQARSNRVTGREHRALPIAFRCRRCETGDVNGAEYVFAFCLTCRSAHLAPYLADLMIGGPIPAAGRPEPSEGDEDPPIAYRLGVARSIEQLRDRVAALVVACSWCGATPGEPCVGVAGRPLVRSGAHASRVADAEVAP